MAGKPTEEDSNITSESDGLTTTTDSSNDSDPLQAYDVVANYSEDELREFLQCVTASTKDLATNKTGSIAQILLERETQVLREESGSGDDSPDSSKHKQSRTKPRHSATRHLQNRSTNASSRYHQGFTSSSSNSDSHHSGAGSSSRGGGGGGSSAAARNTAGSLGSLHDLSTDQVSGHGSGRGGQHSGHGAGSSRRQPGAAAQSSGAGGGSGAGGEASGDSGAQRASTRVRTGGSCGNLSRSSFDTQPPGARRRARRSREAAPASTSTKEGGSLQNLSKVEAGGGHDQKRLQKSGSLSQVFCDEAAAVVGAKVKGRRRKASSETQQQQQQRASEERSSIPADDETSSEEEDEEDVPSVSYQRLSPHHSPPPPSSREDEAIKPGAAAAASSAGPSQLLLAPPSSLLPPSGVPPTLLPLSLSAQSSTASSEAEDELHRVEVDEQRRSAHITVASALAADTTTRPGEEEEEEGVELMEVVSHTAHSDTGTSSWFNNAGAAAGATATEVDKSIGFFNPPTNTRGAEGGAQFSRSHSIESDAFTSKNAADGRGSERERLRTQHSEPSQLGKSKDRNGNPLGLNKSTLIQQQMSTSTLTTSSTGAYSSGGVLHSRPPIVAMAQLANTPCSVSTSSASSIILSPTTGTTEGNGGSGSASSLLKEAERKRANRAAKKKKQAEVTTVDTNNPEYIGNQNIDTILSFLGESGDKQEAGNAKKKKKQPVTNKRDKREEGGGGGGAKKVVPQEAGAAKQDEECKDDHKKEDSGGGGSPPAADKKKKNTKKDEKKAAGKADDGANKKDLLEKELKKNGIVCSSGRSSISGAVDDDAVSSVKSTVCDSKRNSVRSNVDSNSVVDTASAADDNSQSMVSSDQEANSETSSSAVVDTTKVASSVLSKSSDERKGSSSGAASSTGGAGSSTANTSGGKRGKKGGKGGRTMRESSSVEDLVSKCKQSEQIDLKNKQTTVDDGEVSKKRSKDKVPTRKSSESTSTKADNKEPKEIIVKEKDSVSFAGNNKNRRAVDDIKVKSSSSSVNNKNSGNANSSTNNTSSNKKLSRRLSSSNSNLSTSGKESSEFGRDFYQVGDVYEAGTGSNEMLSVHSNAKDHNFEVVSRKKNRNKKAPVQTSYGGSAYSSFGTPVSSASGASGSVVAPGGSGGARSRWGEEYAAREGYREYTPPSTSTSNFSLNSSCNFNTTPTFISSKNTGSRHPPSIASKVQASSSTVGKRKPPINFDEAPRTPHDGNFMAHLSAVGNPVPGGNTATSAPNSDCSDSDGNDSVHSMPTSSSTRRPDVRRPPSSSDTTPQASYANIARLASTSSNKKQVKRLGSDHTRGHNSGSGSAGHSAAACATSDQSLLTTNAWPRISSGGFSATTTAAAASNIAATGAATSSPAIPTAVGRAGATSSGGLSHIGGGRQAVVTASAVVAQGTVQPTTQNFLQDNFPPLLKSAANVLPGAAAMAASGGGPSARQASFEADAATGLTEPLVCRSKETAASGGGSVRTQINSEGGKRAFSERSSKTPDKESSPLVDSSANLGAVHSSVCLVPLPKKQPPRSTAASALSIKENTPEPKTLVQCKEYKPSPRDNPSSNRNINSADSINGHATVLGLRPLPPADGVNRGLDARPVPGLPSDRNILQQVSSNVDNKQVIQSKTPRDTVKKQRSLDLNSQGDPAAICPTNNRNTNKNLSKPDVKKKHNSPVVFSERLQNKEYSSNNSSDLSFMFGSNEDLTNTLDLPGPNVTVNNIVNSSNTVVSNTSSNSGNVTNQLADANGNPISIPTLTATTTTSSSGNILSHSPPTTTSTSGNILSHSPPTTTSSIVPSSDSGYPGALHSDTNVSVSNLARHATPHPPSIPSPGNERQPASANLGVSGHRQANRTPVDVHPSPATAGAMEASGYDANLQPVFLGEQNASNRPRVYFRRSSTDEQPTKYYNEVAGFFQSSWDHVSKLMSESSDSVTMFGKDQL